MNRFAALLDRLAYEPRRLGKLKLLEDYFRSTPDPDRGWALAAMTGALTFKNAKAGLILRSRRSAPIRCCSGCHTICRRSGRDGCADVAGRCDARQRAAHHYRRGGGPQ
ncbi:MAG: hypothetical protein R3C16_10865 [Hyphomonadaceae bacterium]